MKFYHKFIIGSYWIILLILALYSFVLVDPNITFVNHPIWIWLRELLVQFGYYQRETSSNVYLALITLLFAFNIYFTRYYNEIKIKYLLPPFFILAIFSYPLLSHDFFNYLFDAKILSHYGQNPYLFKALDFPSDPWLRFMHWTHRTYPYGPVFLIFTLPASFSSFGKFTVNFLLLKMSYALVYFLAINYLYKINKKSAIFILTQPLVIIEGLVNSHNDFIAVSFALLGIYLLFKRRNIGARVLLFLSGGIKYLTLPLILITKDKKKINAFILLVMVSVLFYLSVFSEIQPWYFMNLLPFVIFYESWIWSLNFFFFGLLLSYYPYIREGAWGITGNITLKHNIIIVFLIINLIYLLFINLIKRRLVRTT